MKQQKTANVLLRLATLFTLFVISGCSESAGTPSAINTGRIQEPLTTFVIGDQTVYTTSDYTPGGMAEAVRYTASQSGPMNTLNLCVAAGNTAKEIRLGLYASLANGTKPAALLTSGIISSGSAIVPGQYAVSVPQINVAQGTHYWLALLAPKGKGTATYCARSGTSNYGAFATNATNLTALPATYPTSGTRYNGWTDTFFGSYVTSDGGTGGQGGMAGNGGVPAGGAGAGGISGAGGSSGMSGNGGMQTAGGSGIGGAPGGSAGDAAGSTSSGGFSGSGGSAGDSSAGASGSGGTACTNGAYIVQQAEHLKIYPDFIPGEYPDFTVTFAQPVQDGSTVLVFANEFNINGNPPGYGAPSAITVKDSTNSSYTLLEVGNEPEDLEANMLFARQHVTGGPSVITAHYIAAEWLDLYAIEVACVTPTSVIDSVVQVYTEAPIPSTTNAGMLQLNGARAFVLAFGISGMGRNGPFSPGVGFTAAGTALNWDGVEGTAHQPAARLESAHVTGLTTLTPTFTSSWTWDRALNISIALQEQ